jgi:hypothetical protein
MVIPRLIQRATIRKPLNEYRDHPLTRAVELDYMGNALFEFGSLPTSLLKIESKFDQFKLTRVNHITQDGSPLRVFHCLGADDFNQYIGFLSQKRANEYLGAHTEELLMFCPTQWPGMNIDLWWDIGNQVIWSFDKLFMGRLRDHLSASFSHMCESTRAAYGEGA